MPSILTPLVRATIVRTLVALPFLITVSLPEALGGTPQSSQFRIPSRPSPISAPSNEGPYMVLECRDSVVNLSINWRERVGARGEKYRHLFYHVDGDKHLMLPVLDAAGEWTGYVNQTAKAKSLVQAILQSVRGGDIPIGVFPAGRDPVTGQWIDAFFSARSFQQAATEVSNACKWDPRAPAPNAHEQDNVSPG
jgi:hypothetical protein